MHARRDNRKLGQATFADFHKVNVIFVSEDVYKLAWCVTFVVIAFEIWIILDVSSNCYSCKK